MKKFLIKLIIISVPVITIIITYEAFLRSIPNDYRFKSENLSNKADSIECLILGSSHAYRGINPKFLECKAFNAAYISQSIDLDYLILEKFITELKNLKTLIVPVSYQTLYNKLEFSSENWRLKNYNIYYDLPVGSVFSSEVTANSWKFNLIRLKDYYLGNKDFINSDETGWGTFSEIKLSGSIQFNAKMAVKRHSATKEFEDNLMLYLNSIGEICEKHDINLCLVSIPVMNIYFSQMDNNQWLHTQKLLQNFVADNSFVSYYNFLNDSRFTNDDFYNSDHLNARGAKKFSLLLNDTLMNQ